MNETLITILLCVSCVLSAAALVAAIAAARKKPENSEKETLKKLDEAKAGLDGRISAVQTSVSEAIRTLSSQQTETAMKDAQTMKNSLDAFAKQVETMSAGMDKRMAEIRVTMETRLGAMQEDNNKRLSQIETTVNEKLQKTLDERVTNSFKTVNEQLEKVYKGLGEMQTLATGVGDLKKVLSNVKTRGILGEMQLDRILEDILTPAQYDTNVITKKGSKDPVEFAVKIPSKDSDTEYVYMPIDSKFPLERYAALQDAYEQGDAAAISAASAQLEAFIKENAKSIREKYIDPPHTTEFGVMFLPTEGLYAEVVRRTELVSYISSKYHINVAGPSTVSALLNSLQMGFKTLAIEKRSHEVWKILGAVKTEFGKFEKELSTLQKSLEKASASVDALVTTRTRLMMSKLKKVEELPEEESKKILDDADATETDDE